MKTNHTWKIVLSGFVFPLVFVPLLSGCSKPMDAQTEYVLGTICTVNLFDRGTTEIYHEIFARLREIDDRMSANKADTDLDRINKNAGIAAVKVHPDVVSVVSEALHFADISDGAFDPSVGPLVNLWGIGTDGAHIPESQEIAKTLPLINWRDVVVDPKAETVYLKRPGMRLDLGAIAKGYAADEVARIVRDHGIPRAIIDLGGNVLAYGSKKDGSPWRIGIQDPLGNRGSYIGIVQVINKTLVTSGVYERFFIKDGKRYHHILSTKDGYPVQNGLDSVTIIGDRSIDADGLSTTVFALGYERGKELVESLPSVEAIFVFNDKTIKATSGVEKNFKLENSAYTLVE
jgi:thiamine biosynthesis lipoprotein